MTTTRSESGRIPRGTLPWIIATIVLAVTTVAFGVWALSLNRKASDLQSSYDQLKVSTDAQLAQVSSELEQVKNAAGTSQTTNAVAIAKLRAQVRQYQKKLQLGGAVLREGGQALKTQQAQLKAASKRYRAAKAQAARAEGNLRLQLAASRAETLLARRCATVLGVGLVKMYQSVPTIVTYQEVNQAVKAASVACADVVVPTS